MTIITDQQLDRINRLRNTPLVMAARLNDLDVSEAVGGEKLPRLLAKHGLDNMSAVLHVIEQRMLRAEPLGEGKVFALALDMLFIGWRAARLTDVEVASTTIGEPITRADFDAWTRERATT